MQRTATVRISALLALALLSQLSGCDTRNPTAPQFQTQVINLRNDLAVQVTGLEAVTRDLVYTWQNDGTSASVLQAPTNLTGTALLFVLDGAGMQVYQRSVAENGTFTTTAGMPGSWTVRVHLAEASGAVALRLVNK